MKGSIQKRTYESGKTVYRVQVDVPSHDPHKERTRISETFDTREEAERFRLDINHRVEFQNYKKADDLTVEDLLYKWLKHKEGDVAPRTFQGYKKDVEKHLVPAFGNRSIQALDTFSIQDFYDRKQEGGRQDQQEGGLSPSTIHQIHVVLHSAFKWAVSMRIIDRNPAKATNPPSGSSKEMNILTEDELAEFLNQVQEHGWFPMIFETAVYTGLRRSELLALRWKDVELTKGTATIQNTLHVTGPDHEYGTLRLDDTTKTESSRRTINLPPGLLQRLKDYRGKQWEWKNKVGEGWGDHQNRVINQEEYDLDFVFTDKAGGPIYPNWVTDHFRDIMDGMDLDKHIRFHDLRHSFVSIMIREEVPITTISKHLGHSEVSTTLNEYAHLMPGMREDAIQRFDDVMETARSRSTLTG